MSYFTLRFRSAAGDILYERDFTLHELIPLVRQTLRSLAQQPEIAADPTGYRVIIQPCYDWPPPDAWTSDTPAEGLLPPGEEGGILQLSEEDFLGDVPVSLRDELRAFYD